jgi:type I restriction modification DNA specificity domain protein
MKVMLKEIGNIITGNTPSKNSKEFWNSKDICFIKPDIIADAGVYEICESNEYISECARKKARIVSKDSIFVTCIGSIGKIGITGEGEYAFNQQINAIVPNKKVNPRYLAYNLLFNKSRLIAIANAPVVPIINKSQFGEFVISIESDISEQSKIVDILDKLSSLIEKYNGEIVALDKLVKARFVEMFGDPIRNQKDWEIVSIGDIITDVRYGTSKPAVKGGKYPYLRMNNLTEDGHLDLNDLKYIDIQKDEIEKCVVRKGDVLFNRTNSIDLVGKTAVFDLSEDMVIAGYIIRVRLNGRILPEVFSQYMNLEALKDILRSMAKGAVNQANINAQELQSIKVYVPDMKLQKQFVEIKEQVNKSKVEVKKALDEAQLLFDSLMQKYFG